MDQQWAVMRAALGERDHLVGSHMTAADIYLLMFAKWFADMGGIADDDSAMAAWREGMLARPAIKSVLARHESGAWA